MKKINIKPEYIYIFKALVILSIITFVSNVFKEHLQIINIALIHIIPVVFVAIYGNMKVTFLITFLSVILLNFLYIPPLYSFDINNELYIWSFFIFVFVGWIITIQARDLNTKTKQKDEQMQQSLTFFAVTHNKPAFAIETSKNITELTYKVIYQLKSIEEFMKIMNIEFERDFDLNNYEEVKSRIYDFGKIKINDNIGFDLSDIKNNMRLAT